MMPPPTVCIAPRTIIAIIHSRRILFTVALKKSACIVLPLLSFAIAFLLQAYGDALINALLP